MKLHGLLFVIDLLFVAVMSVDNARMEVPDIIR